VVFLDNERTCTIRVHRPKINELVFFFISGVIVSVPFVVFFSQFTDLLCVDLPFFYATICSTVLFAPFIEEFAKVMPLFYRHGETERSFVTLGALIGLGFGVTELILYVSVLSVPVLERIPAVVFHASSATITAYGLTRKKPVPYYLLAGGLHLSNNLLAAVTVPVFSLLGAIMVVVAALLLAYRFFQKTSPLKVVENV
jgi:RsiW-degrading membrane proteinase PrsW (M82 family)